jgi:hypothetical protein
MGLIVRNERAFDSALADRDETLRAMRVFLDPEGIHNLVALPTGTHREIDGSRIDKAIIEAEAVAFDKGLYFTMNPARRRKVSVGQVRNEDVVRRRWILIDIDRDLPKEIKTLNATHDEKQAIIGTLDAVDQFFTRCGWPCPVMVDSGNGIHLYFRVDLPNDEPSHDLVKRFLKALSRRFSVPGISEIDTSVHDARRVSKLPGSWVRKSEHTEERPHRKCTMWHCPDVLVVVSAELIENTIKELSDGDPDEDRHPEPVTKIIPPPKIPPFVLRATKGGSERAYVKVALEKECAKLRMTSKYRNNSLARAAFILGGYVRDGLLTAAEVEDSLMGAARACGLIDDPNDGPTKTLDTIRRCMGAGQEKPFDIPPLRNRVADILMPKPSANGKHELERKNPLEFDTITISAADVIPKRVEWLWPNRIPASKLTTFAGQAGLGKSFVLCDIAARLSRGDEWPFAGGEKAKIGRVMYISGEDDDDDTLVPRLIACGADRSNVRLMRPEVTEMFDLHMIEAFERIVKEVNLPDKPPLRLVVVDPPTSFMGDADENSNAEVRSMLGPIKAFTQRHKIAVVLNTHVNKGGGHVDALSRALGSVAWVNKARAYHVFGRDNEDPTKRMFVPAKVNVGPEVKGLMYRLSPSSIWVPKVEWLGEIEGTADEIIQPSRPRRRYEDVMEFLVEMFNERQEWRSTDVDDRLKAAGFSKSTSIKAKDELHIRALQKAGHDGERYWVWWVPSDWKHLRKGQT